MATRTGSGRGGGKGTRTRSSGAIGRLSGAARAAAELPRLPRTARRVHDAVDLAGGRIETTALTRAPSAASRLRRLARFGIRIDLPIFGAPAYRLTPRTPYQRTPEAWLDSFDGSYGTGPGVDRIWWRLPASFPTTFMAAVNFSFRGVPAGPAVLSLAFEAWPYQGRTGTVVVDIGAQRTELAIDAPVERTVDIGFTHGGASPLVTMVFFRPGLIDFVFRSVTLGGPPAVVAPTV